MQETHFSLFLLFSLLTLILFTSLPTISSSFPTDTFVYGGCSHLKYAPGTPFQSNLNTLLSSLLDSSSLSSYNSYNISSPTIYGLYQCRGDISTVDCPKCIQTAISQLGVLCLDACGGAIRLQGCFVKYDNATFVGVEVKTSVVKTCGSMTNEYGTDLLSSIDEVLMQLGSGNGSYRVGTAGCVSSMAQCVGDLDGGECSDCITEAVQQLRTGCGLTLSGDVYLAKCYVRYSAKCNVRYSARGEDEKRGSSLPIPSSSVTKDSTPPSTPPSTSPCDSTPRSTPRSTSPCDSTPPSTPPSTPRSTSPCDSTPPSTPPSTSPCESPPSLPPMPPPPPPCGCNLPTCCNLPQVNPTLNVEIEQQRIKRWGWWNKKDVEATA